MPTPRGWTAIGVAAALLVLWYAFGAQELMMAALFLLAAVIGGCILSSALAPRFTVGRRLYPWTAHEGDIVSAEVHATPFRSMMNVELEDAVHGLGVARFASARLRAGEPVIARYEVVCRQRGSYPVGPATITVTDPLGLVERSRSAGPIDHLVVYPRVEELRGYPVGYGSDTAPQASRPRYSPTGGDDFFTLREYEIGDDLRKVHWPSTAKRDNIMIKQLEIPWQARAVVLFDTRSTQYENSDIFEHAVRGAASAITHLHDGGFNPRLWTPEHAPSTDPRGLFQQAMDVLATIGPSEHTDIRGAAALVRRNRGAGGAFILVTGQPDDAVLGVSRLLADAFTRTVVMAAGDDVVAASRLLGQASLVLVASPAASTWALPWRTAMETAWSTASVG